MAYAALSSLMYTLEQLLKPNQSLVSGSCAKHVESVYQSLCALQVFLEDTTKEAKDIETLKVIEKRIRKVVHKAEDTLDTSLRNISLADCREIQGASKFFEEELLQMEKYVDSLRKEVMVIEFNKHGSKSAELVGTPSAPEKNTIEESTIIVGMEDDFNTILDHLISQIDELTVIPIFGMGGIGKTTLAKKVYDNSSVHSRFDKRAWVTISQEYNKRQMLLEVVSSITESNQEMSDDQLMEIVYRGLKGRRFLIVIDDIWSTQAWDQMQRIFPNDDNKSRILLTTRLKCVADYVSCPYFLPLNKSFLSLHHSWNLFSKILFNKESCPPLLEEIGKHIVKKCQGLPLSIVVVAGLLRKLDPTHDNWGKVEKNLNSFFGTVSERCQSILSLSYSYLPQYLRACFLYVGAFPEDKVIHVSMLIRLWISEQFIRTRSNKRLEVVAEEYLEELIERSLILPGTRRANGRMKTCKIHDLLRQLCMREAKAENGLYLINGDVPRQVSAKDINDQRRVILSKFCVYPSGDRSDSGIISITRTFISMDILYRQQHYPFEDHAKWICSIVSHFKLLQVLDVLTIDYDFSSVIPQLLHLRYVAARIDKALSLGKLRNLQTIILQRTRGTELEHSLDIWQRTQGTELEHPLDIWSMSEIRHLDIEPPLYISNPLEAECHSIMEQPLFLNNLQTLYLRYSPFVVKIIRTTPNLKKLKIFCKSMRSNWPYILDYLILLEELETLHIEMQTIERMIFSRDTFPPNLKKLRLSCTEIPWEVMNFLANLPNLEVISGCHAFKGTDWRMNEDVVFRKLKQLKIKHGDLERWEACSDNFPMLEELFLVELFKLEEIPQSIGEIMTLKSIRIKRCSRALETSAMKIQEEQHSWGNYELQVSIVGLQDSFMVYWGALKFIAMAE